MDFLNALHADHLVLECAHRPQRGTGGLQGPASRRSASAWAWSTSRAPTWKAPTRSRAPSSAPRRCSARGACATSIRTAASGCSSARSPMARCARWRWAATASRGITLVNTLPQRFEDVEALEDFMSEPTPGSGGRPGAGGRRPHRHRRRRQDGADAGAHGQARGAGQAGHRRGALQQPGVRAMLEAHGVECIACDLLDRDAVRKLPTGRRRAQRACSWLATSSAPPTTHRSPG